MISKQTRKYKTLKIIFWLLSFISVVLPLLIPIVSAYLNNEIKSAEKLVLTFTITVALVLTIFNLLGKAKLRSPFFILLIGLFNVLSSKALIDTLIIVTICVVIDEVVFNPLYKHFKSKYLINKEIDERL